MERFYNKNLEKSAMNWLFYWFGWSLGCASLDGGTDRAVNGSWFAFFGIFDLFVFGVHKRVLTVLADKDFVGHGDILHE